jgi:hypothetical protein
MATLEQVEKLREKANVSFEEARAALDACNGDLLEAIIYLEKQGKVNAPAGGGYYNSNFPGQDGDPGQDAGGAQTNCHNGASFREGAGKFGRFLARVFQIGNSNALEARKNGEVLFACPVTALVLLLIFFFWIVVPLFILSLFFGFRYRFVGPELGTENVNRVMDGASETADDIKNNFRNEK